MERDLNDARGNHGDGRDLFRAGGVNSIGPNGISNGVSFPNTNIYQNGIIKDSGVTISDIGGIPNNEATMRVVVNVLAPSPTPSGSNQGSGGSKGSKGNKGSKGSSAKSPRNPTPIDNCANDYVPDNADQVGFTFALRNMKVRNVIILSDLISTLNNDLCAKLNRRRRLHARKQKRKNEIFRIKVDTLEEENIKGNVMYCRLF